MSPLTIRTRRHDLNGAAQDLDVRDGASVRRWQSPDEDGLVLIRADHGGVFVVLAEPDEGGRHLSIFIGNRYTLPPEVFAHQVAEAPNRSTVTLGGPAQGSD